jgi:hypothetical protein
MARELLAVCLAGACHSAELGARQAGSVAAEAGVLM